MSCRVIAFANTKGGVGKSTLAGNLAWALASKRYSVAAVDADPQASLTKWCDLAEAVPFDRYQLNTPRLLHHQVPRLRRRHQYLLIDCPPMPPEMTMAALALSDLGLIPIQPSPLDVLAYSELFPLLRQAEAANPRLQLFFVVNQLAPGTVLAREVEESLGEAEIRLLRTRIQTRQLYRRVVAEGGSVIERRGPAQAEIFSLLEDVLDATKDPKKP